jgi:tetratricopeptide (TPR) repeat protein
MGTRFWIREFFAPTLLLVAIGALASASLAADLDSPPRFLLADQAYIERVDPEKALFAMERYQEIYRSDPQDWQAAWRFATACYFIGDRVVVDKGERETLFAQGRDAAESAAKMEPDCAPCHLLAGVNMALYGESVGILKMLFTLRPIRDYLKRSLELDPAFEGGAAARILGTIEQTIPFLLGGSKKRALAYFERALEIDSREPLNYFYFAKFLDRKEKDPRAALAVALRGLEEPRPSEERLESMEAWDRLKNWIPSLRERAERKKSKRRFGFGRRAKNR